MIGTIIMFLEPVVLQVRSAVLRLPDRREKSNVQRAFKASTKRQHQARSASTHKIQRPDHRTRNPQHSKR
jgi:hypothetical protein